MKYQQYLDRNYPDTRDNKIYMFIVVVRDSFGLCLVSRNRVKLSSCDARRDVQNKERPCTK